MHLSFRNKCWIELETVEKAMKFVYANENHSTMINEKNGVVFLTFPKLVKAGVCHGFSTRIGGVSEGYLSSMNLSFTRGDDPQKVQENAGVVGNCGYQAIVDDHIQRSDGGKALCEQRPHHNTDKEGAVGLLGNKRQRDSDHRRQQRPDRTVQAAGSGLLTGSQHRDAQQSGGQCGQQRCAQDRMLLHGISPFVFRFQYGGA